MNRWISSAGSRLGGRLTWRSRVAAIAAVVLSGLGVGVMPASAGTPVPPSSNFWARMPTYAEGDLYVTKDLELILMETWRNDPGQAWHFVQIIRPGFYNIYKIETASGTGCLAEAYQEANAPLTIGGCNSYPGWWQMDWRSSNAFKLRNTASGLCLTYHPYPYGDTFVYPCDPDSDLRWHQAFMITT
jgi:hypothetical protein